MDKILEKTKSHFLKTFTKKKHPIYIYLPKHVAQVERWARKIARGDTIVDKNILLPSVWLHDIGLVIGNDKSDHAIKSEEEAKRFLKKIGVEPERIKKIAHCVRAHRCRDIKPTTKEAKVLAVADSISHLTDFNYIVHCQEGEKRYALSKIERDYRDIGLFPKLQREITPLYRAWKKLLNVFPD